jgi:hypothetical protein
MGKNKYKLTCSAGGRFLLWDIQEHYIQLILRICENLRLSAV